MKWIMFIVCIAGSVGMVMLFPNNQTLAVGWYMIFLLSGVLMHFGARAWNIKKPTISSIWYLTFLIMIFFPALVVAIERNNAWTPSYLTGVALAALAVPIGIVMANALLRFSHEEIKRYYDAAPDQSRPSRLFTFIIIATLIACTAVVVAYLASLRTIPLLYMFQHPGDTAALTILREESFKLFDPRWQGEQSTYFFYLLLFLRTLLFPLFITALFGYALVSKKISWWFAFFYSLGLGGFYAASSIARAPLAAIFMRLFFFAYLFARAHLPRWLIAAFGILIIAFPLAVTSLSHGSGAALNIGETTLSLARRFTITPADDLYYYFEVFPDYYPFLNGETLVKPFLKLFDKEYFYIENFVYKHISPLSPYETGHANAAFISNLYADFALWGVLIGSLLVGFFMQLLQIYILRQPKNVMSITLFAFCIYAIWALNFGSVTSVLLVNGIIPALIAYAIIARWLYPAFHHSNKEVRG